MDLACTPSCDASSVQLMAESKPDYVAILERCYAEAENDRAWISALLESAGSGVDRGLGLAFQLIAETEAGARLVQHEGTGIFASAALRTQLATDFHRIDRTTYKAMYYADRVSLASQTAGRLNKGGEQGRDDALRGCGAVDFLGLIGHPLPGYSCAVLAPTPRPMGLTGRVAEAFHRLLIHIETGVRLRLAPGAIMAVLSPEGRVRDATGNACANDERQRLAHQVRQIERSRTRNARTSPDHALGVWRALVEGRWCLVERFERDGRRDYYAYENPPYARRYRGLTATECKVLDLTIGGLMGKQVAYALGLSEGRVSECLGAAAAKLGLPRRADLIRLGAGFAVGDAKSLTHPLSSAEAEVLELLRAGLTNAAIASARNTSVRTVANQVAAILRKTNASSRRALCTLHLDDAP